MIKNGQQVTFTGRNRYPFSSQTRRPRRLMKSSIIIKAVSVVLKPSALNYMPWALIITYIKLHLNTL